MFAETVSVPLFVPEAGETPSQFPPEVVLDVAVQFSVPPPLFDTLTVLLAGLAPPAVAAKLSATESSKMVGDPGAAGLIFVTKASLKPLPYVPWKVFAVVGKSVEDVNPVT